MYNIRIRNIDKAHRYEELIKLFFKPDEFLIVLDKKDINASRSIGIDEFLETYLDKEKCSFSWEFTLQKDINKLCRDIVETLSSYTGIKLPWGILTGIRPSKLYNGIIKERLSYLLNKNISTFEISQDKISQAISLTNLHMREEYLISESKISLLEKIFKYQNEVFTQNNEREIGIYIGIPFCPTRCYYCSFTSNQGDDKDKREYLDALKKEIDDISIMIKEERLKIESIYIGGGTPTSLDEVMLQELLDKVVSCFDTSKIKEFTVEAGRADTITKEKLKLIKNYGATRISINPQTMKDETLRLIGRNHSVNDVNSAFKMAYEVGIDNINADLIVGLPEETDMDFLSSLDNILKLNPSNITIHTLATKRSSKIGINDKTYHYHKGIGISEVLDKAYDILYKKGYEAYYMYRQKNMLGMGENIGFAKKDRHSIYNYRIMEEEQSILALGAGGISKKYYPDEDRIERFPNVNNYREYINRVDEMVMRKYKGFKGE